MTTVAPGDILIVGNTSNGESSFLIVDAVTKRCLCGPFPTLRDTLQRAAQLRRDGAIWHKHMDDRGRELGPPLRLPMRIGKSQ